MKIYTRTGDAGQTSLFGGQRVGKVHPRVAACGAVDELNAAIGWAATWVEDADLAAGLERIQGELFVVGADLATPGDANASAWLQRLPDSAVASLETAIDDMDAAMAPLTTFILPGGSRGGAALHLARAVCRRAERDVVAAAHDTDLSAPVMAYLNRLSDWLFTAARLANARAGVSERTWRQA